MQNNLNQFFDKIESLLRSQYQVTILSYLRCFRYMLYWSPFNNICKIVKIGQIFTMKFDFLFQHNLLCLSDHNTILVFLSQTLLFVYDFIMRKDTSS